MRVQIIEKMIGKVVQEYSIDLGSINCTVKESEYFDMAWENAIEDQLVAKNDRQDYLFKLLKANNSYS